MSIKRINREATIEKIIEAAGNNIRDIEELRKADDIFILEAAELWDVKVVYE